MEKEKFDPEEAIRLLIKGHSFTEKEIKQFNSFPLMDELRTQVAIMDICDELKESLLKEDDRYRAILWINLSQPYLDKDRTILKTIKEKYKKTSDPLIKIESVFRLLDYEKDDSVIGEYIDLFVNDWMELGYTDIFPGWYGDTSVLEIVERKINSKEISNKKKWVYIFLCLEDPNLRDIKLLFSLLNDPNVEMSTQNRIKIEDYIKCIKNVTKS